MTGKLDLYKAFYNASWANPPASFPEAAMKYLADDFKNLDPDGKVLMDRAGWIGMSQMLVTSIAGFKSVITSMKEVEDGVVVTAHFEGTHTSDLDLSALGAGVSKASGKHIVWPDATNKFTIEGDKITGVQGLAGAGREAFLAPLGVKMPAAS